MGAWVHGYMDMGNMLHAHAHVHVGFPLVHRHGHGHSYMGACRGHVPTWRRRAARTPIGRNSRRDAEMVTCLPPVKLHRRFNGVAQWVRAGGAADGAQLSLGRGLYVAAYEGLPPRPDGRAACTLDHQECARPFNPADSQEEQVVLGRALGRGRLLAPLLAQPQARAGALHHGPQVHARSRGPAHRTCSRSHALSTTRATATCACSAATAATATASPVAANRRARRLRCMLGHKDPFQIPDDELDVRQDGRRTSAEAPNPNPNPSP